MKIVRSEKYDVVVIGGGPAGVCAAIAAARKKKNVLLVEKYGFLGGTGTSAMFNPWRGFFAGGRKTVSGIADEIVDRLIALKGSPGHTQLGDAWVALFDAEKLKFVLQEMVLEANVTMLLHSEFIESKMTGRHLDSILLHCREGIVEVAGRSFIDATGTGDVAFSIGAKTNKGNTYASYRFSMTNVDVPQLLSYARENPREFSSVGVNERQFFSLNGFSSFAKQWSNERNELHPSRTFEIESDLIAGNVIVSMIKIPNVDPASIESMSNGGILCQTMPMKAAEFLSKNIPGFADARILVTPPQFGFHAARKVEGIIPVTYAKIMGGESYYDSVGTFALPGAIGATFQVSKRSMQLTECENLLVTGRAILPLIALYSTNNQPASMKLGESAGIIASQS